jgi:signal transduction histidine kinase
VPAADTAALILPVEPVQHGGAVWAVPLWRERGLIGVLLFGPRRDDGLYTREEIEIARGAGERLLDAAASVALSQRLVQLQRERMAATQVLDQRTRRALHDEVLPLIHTAILSLGAGAAPEKALRQLSDAHQEVSKLLAELPPTVLPEISRLGLLGALRQAVEVEFSPAFAAVDWRWSPAAEQAAASLSPLAAETLYFAAREAVRNAAKHARAADRPAKLRLAIAVQAQDGQLQLAIEDNGPGLPAEPGAGHGLALHSTLMAVVGGSLALDSAPGGGTRVLLALPLK